MDPIRFGRQFRALRVNRRLRQADVAERAGVSRSLAAKIDRGEIENVAVGSLDRAARAIGARFELRLVWRGEGLDRLLDEAHARLVEVVVGDLRRSGWTVAVEVSFSEWGERGSIDVFASHPVSGLVVVEVKSVVPDSQATLHGLDRKARLAPKLSADRGWPCRGVARLLVIGDGATARRRIARLGATYDAVLPIRGRAVRHWLADPGQPIGGLMFVSFGTRGGARRTAIDHQQVRRGVRRPRRAILVQATPAVSLGSPDRRGGPGRSPDDTRGGE